MDDIIEIGKKVLKDESEAISNIISHLDDNFRKAVDLLQENQGLVIVIGMGKSGDIGKKISATFTSTGQRSIFLHPSEGEHGDLGIITENDICIILSHSGSTEEVARIIPFIKRKKAKIVSISSNEKSKIAKQSDIFLNTYVRYEADPLNLAPTSSSTATLAIGDALAVTLSKIRNFSKEDFAMHHPGGVLGKKLLLKVEDIMLHNNVIVLANPNTEIKSVLFEMTKKKQSFASIIDDKNKILGLITDGDIRRNVVKNPSLLNSKCKDIMHKKPITIKKEILAYDALSMMKKKQISCLLIEENKQLIGAIDNQEIARTGIK